METNNNPGMPLFSVGDNIEIITLKLNQIPYLNWLEYINEYVKKFLLYRVLFSHLKLKFPFLICFF